MARRFRKQDVDVVSGNNWIRVGDTVQVVAGEHKGSKTNPKRAKVIRVLPKTRQVVVEGVNIVFKHKRKDRENPRGGRVEMEAPIDISNVALVCPSTNAPTRRKIKVGDDGKKIRVSSHDGTEIPLPSGR